MEEIRFALRTDEPFIPLIALLKVVNVVASGSEAQQVVVAGLVQRNGAVETRKRAKIVAGDVIDFQQFRIIVTA